MSLLSPQDRQALTQHLAGLTHDVTLVLFTQTFGGTESGLHARQVLGEVASLHDRIHVVEKNFVLDTDDRAKYGVDKAPAIVVLSGEEDTRVRFYGAPTGYEFVPLIEAVLLAGTRQLDLAPETLALVAGVDTPTRVQVFSTPT